MQQNIIAEQMTMQQYNVFSNKIEKTNPIPEKIFEDSELEHMISDEI